MSVPDMTRMGFFDMYPEKINKAQHKERKIYGEDDFYHYRKRYTYKR